MDKMIITTAITGSVTLPTQTPYLPITPEEIAAEAYKAWKAGSAVVHIHARNPKTGKPVSDLKVYREILRGVKRKCDVVVCITTGGALFMEREERIAVVPEFEPELASFNLGSMNFSIHRLLKRLQQFNHPWEKEYAAMTKDMVFRNTFEDLEYFCKVMSKHGTKPELEVYDVGHLYNANYLVTEGFLTPPLHMQFILGITGGIGATVYDLLHMKSTADRLFGEQNYTWSVLGVGYPAEFHMAAVAIILGGHVRVGLEDNIRLSKGKLARSNSHIVQKVVRIAKELGRDVATPDEARKILKLKGPNNVRF